MKKIFILALALTSCSTFKLLEKPKIITKSSPITTFPIEYSVPSNLKSKKIAIIYFNTNNTIIRGDHYEGSEQIKQFGVYGLNDEQKERLFKNLQHTVAISLILEFKKSELDIDVYGNENDLKSKKYDYIISGNIDKIELNTYGQGIKGSKALSAGNYWESYVTISNIQIKTQKDTKTIKQIDYYSKLLPSPVELTWTQWDVTKKALTYTVTKTPTIALKTAFIVSSVIIVLNKPSPINIYNTVEDFISYYNEMEKYAKGEIKTGSDGLFKPDYKINQFNVSPAEVSARYAAIKIISYLEESSNMASSLMRADSFSVFESQCK